MFRAVAACLLLGACAAMPQNPPISLEERFYQAAFFNEEIGHETRLFRWEVPIRVYVTGATDKERQRISNVLDQISSATGLSAYTVASESADIAVYFISEDERQTILQQQNELRVSLGYDEIDFACITIPGNQNGRLQFTIGIPKALPESIRAACIAQEIGHTTGLFYDAVGRSDTAFGDWAGADHLTETDLLLLKILYDPRLTPGMTWEEARPIVRQIISEMGY